MALETPIDADEEALKDSPMIDILAVAALVVGIAMLVICFGVLESITNTASAAGACAPGAYAAVGIARNVLSREPF